MSHRVRDDGAAKMSRTRPARETARKARFARQPPAVNQTSLPSADQARPRTFRKSSVSAVKCPSRSTIPTRPPIPAPLRSSRNATCRPSRETRGQRIERAVYSGRPIGYSRRPSPPIPVENTAASCSPAGSQSAPSASGVSS
jgi:hypothetical protein